MKYRVRMWQGSNTFFPTIDHHTDSLDEAKRYFYHWIAEYYRTEGDQERYILVTDHLDNEIARCIIHRGGHIEGGGVKKWE